MRHLILMRHAETGMPPIGAPDKERPITMRGQQEAASQATLLISKQLAPDQTLYSSAKRTKATWDMVKSQMREHLPFDFKETGYDALYNASQDTLLKHITAVSENIDVLMVVAHNPGIHELAQKLSSPTSGRAHSSLAMEVQMVFPPASLVIFEVDSLGWHDVSQSTATLVHFSKV